MVHQSSSYKLRTTLLFIDFSQVYRGSCITIIVIVVCFLYTIVTIIYFLFPATTTLISIREGRPKVAWC
jgi:hypothetical protein